jgi:hypothetical protein
MDCRLSVAILLVEEPEGESVARERYVEVYPSVEAERRQ